MLDNLVSVWYTSPASQHLQFPAWIAFQSLRSDRPRYQGQDLREYLRARGYLKKMKKLGQFLEDTSRDRILEKIEKFPRVAGSKNSKNSKSNTNSRMTRTPETTLASRFAQGLRPELQQLWGISAAVGDPEKGIVACQCGSLANLRVWISALEELQERAIALQVNLLAVYYDGFTDPELEFMGDLPGKAGLIALQVALPDSFPVPVLGVGESFIVANRLTEYFTRICPLNPWAIAVKPWNDTITPVACSGDAVIVPAGQPTAQ